MLSNKLFSSIGNTDRLYVDDVFSAYTYTGTGATQTINNGIDLAGKGGLVWTKSRSNAVSHALVDTARGVSSKLSSDLTILAQSMADGVTSVSSTGYTLGTDSMQALVNQNNQTYISWTFRKAPKFFDVVTYTGDGASSKTISHSLGSTPGMIVVKGISATTDWPVYHRMSNGGVTPEQWYTRLNSTSAQTNAVANFGNVAPTSSVFTVGGNNNASGIGYVAYLFAHDASAEGIVQCGGVTGTGVVSVELGWEPQFVLIKATTAPSSGWHIFDTSRGMTVDNTLTGGAGADKRLSANSTSAEDSNSSIEPTATGFRYIEFGSTQTFIYLAIRRPNKPPTTGTQVYNAIARTGTGTAATVTGVGFAPDVSGIKDRAGGRYTFNDRLRGPTQDLWTYTGVAEATSSDRVKSFDMSGISLGTDAPGFVNFNGSNYINHFFRRAPGFMDVVCSQSTPSGDLNFSHGLGVVPELIIHKDRGYETGWDVWTTAFGGKHYLKLNSTSAATSVSHPSTLTATTVFSGSGSQTGNSPQVCYLFASLPGISKVGSYTGNGSSQTINCGFSTGARFILIKRTDSTGDWYVWDTARGIIAANDPHLSLNTAAAEVTTNDSVDPDSTGFIVNQVAATNINVNGATYLYLAIA